MNSKAARQSVSRWALMTVLAAALCSAGLAPVIAQPPSTPPGESATTKPQAALEQKQPVITLLDGGAEPRQALRLKVTKGATAAFEIINNIRMSTSVAGAQQPPQVLPGMRMLAQMSVPDVQSNGDVAFEFQYTDASIIDTPGVQPMVANAVRKSMESMKGTRGSGVLSNRCIPRTSTITLPEHADPMLRQQIDQLSQSMNQMSVPLPEEPVGVGGRWRVESDMIVGGMALKMVNEVTLKSIAGSVIMLEMAITQTAEPQDVSLPHLPPGAKLRLNSLKASGAGSSTIDLTRIAPLAGESKITSDADMTITMSNMPQPQQMTQHMEMAMSVKNVPSE